MTNHVSFFFLAAVICALYDIIGAHKYNKTEVIEISSNVSLLEKVESHMNDMMRWMRNSAQSRDSFMGRCIGAVRRLRSVILFLVFALGIILTTLKFLTIFVLKGLAIGLTLLVLNISGLVAKFATIHTQPKIPQKEQAIHVHVHGKVAPPENPHHSTAYGGPEYEQTYYSDWDRSMSLSKPNARRRKLAPNLDRPLTALEKLELMRLYERLGLTQKISEVT